MADTVQDLLQNVKENLTENATNTTSKIPATPEGMAVAYGSLVIMALFPIFFGSFRSVKHHKEQKVLYQESGEKPETMSHKEALMFPFMASIALFGLYIFFQIFSKEYINMLLTGYFFFLGVLALSHLLSPVISSLVPAAIPNIPFHLHFKQGGPEGDVDLINYHFSSHDIVCLVCCSLVGAWYIIKKHWIANNLFGLAFAINGVELLNLNNVVTGCILLIGLFFYDVFWVFGTDVMVTVAKSFEAPIKLVFPQDKSGNIGVECVVIVLVVFPQDNSGNIGVECVVIVLVVFPQDLLEQGLSASNFAMLGLGDIVIPGIFIALLLRFDTSLKRSTNMYFNVTFGAYFLGLMATILIMHLFKHAQPALLYLVPACLGAPLGVALLRGDIKALFQYEDHPAEKPDTAAEVTQDTKKDK
uniref:Minor histocompatibility antigen H13 n=2 Tax=Timema TaxID=61471 RepID=A0A7R9ANE5_TIMSH|nr:unnamed protein product [Timema shepardi]CAD7571711.1 unnamed protein product [Timema californicum]